MKYRVCGKRRFLGYEPGEEFTADLEQGIEERAMARGSIEIVGEADVSLDPTQATLPAGLDHFNGRRLTMESGFEIDGKVIPMPERESLTVDEWQVVYDYSGVVMQDLLPADPDATPEEQEAYETARVAKLKNPAYQRALFQIGYQRANPDVSSAKVKEIVGSAVLLDLMASLGRDEEDETSPPDDAASTPQPSGSSPSAPPDSSASSGSSDSEATSEEPDVQLASTGATR